MCLGNVSYDEAAYALDRALDSAAGGDPVAVQTLVIDALSVLADSPYPHLVADSRQYGADAVRNMWAGDVERASDYLRVLIHVVDDMQAFEASELFASA